VGVSEQLCSNALACGGRAGNRKTLFLGEVQKKEGGFPKVFFLNRGVAFLLHVGACGSAAEVVKIYAQFFHWLEI
jgi:hypothetical protein